MRARIRHVSYQDILKTHTTADLLSEYAAECQVPTLNPQEHMYEVLERCGALGCFGAYVEGSLIGFISILVSVQPHSGLSTGSIESVFVSERFRSSGAGDLLLTAAEMFCREQGCISILFLARVDSALARVLSRRPGFRRTHEGFTRWLNDRTSDDQPGAASDGA